jgi:hypothetical protein
MSPALPAGRLNASRLRWLAYAKSAEAKEQLEK